MLDLETLTAETEARNLQAQRVDNSYVGQIEEGRVNGVAFLDEVGAGEGKALEDGIVVHLYDGQELAIVTGAATFPEEQPMPFTAEAATGNGVCGAYWAHGTDEDAEARADWVVLPDGRQWGCVCAPPTFTNPCCHLRQ